MILNVGGQSLSPYSKQNRIAKNHAPVSFSAGNSNEINDLQNTLQKKLLNFDACLKFYEAECNEIYKKTVSELTEKFSPDKKPIDLLKQAIVEIKREKDIQKAEEIVQKTIDKFNQNNADSTAKANPQEIVDNGSEIAERGISEIVKKTNFVKKFFEKNLALEDVQDRVKSQIQAKPLIEEYQKQLDEKKKGIAQLSLNGVEILRKYGDLSNDYKNNVQNNQDYIQSLLDEITQILNGKNNPFSDIKGLDGPFFLN